MEKTFKTFHIHGPAGAGKDTQADWIIERFDDYYKIGAGEMFRSFKNSNDPEKRRLYEKTVQGIWPTDEEVYHYLKEWITNDMQIPNDGRDGNLLFISLVRRASQIPYFDNLLKELDRKLEAFILIEVPEDEIVRRLGDRYYCDGCEDTSTFDIKDREAVKRCEECGGHLKQRSDDTKEAIALRHKQYLREIEEIKEHYEKLGLLVLIDGNQTREAVFNEIVKKVNF